jgi:hypothetical protein
MDDRLASSQDTSATSSVSDVIPPGMYPAPRRSWKQARPPGVPHHGPLVSAGGLLLLMVIVGLLLALVNSATQLGAERQHAATAVVTAQANAARAEALRVLRPDSWTRKSGFRVTSFLLSLLNTPLALELRRRQVAQCRVDPLVLLDLIQEPPQLRLRIREIV